MVFVAAPKVIERILGVTPMPIADLLYRSGASMLLVASSVAYCMQVRCLLAKSIPNILLVVCRGGESIGLANV